MLLPEYRDLLNRALALPALEDDPEHDVVLYTQTTGYPEQGWIRSDVRKFLGELRYLWELGSARDQEQFARYVSNIASGRLAGD